MNSRKRPHAETKEAGRLQELLVLGFLPQDQGNKKSPFLLFKLKAGFRYCIIKSKIRRRSKMLIISAFC